MAGVKDAYSCIHMIGNACGQADEQVDKPRLPPDELTIRLDRADFSWEHDAPLILRDVSLEVLVSLPDDCK